MEPCVATVFFCKFPFFLSPHSQCVEWYFFLLAGDAPRVEARALELLAVHAYVAVFTPSFVLLSQSRPLRRLLRC